MSRIKVLQLQPDYNVKAHDFADLAEQIVKSLPADKFEVVSAFLIGKPESGEPVSVAERSVYFDFTGKDLKGLRLNALWKLYRFCRDESFDVVICNRFKPISMLLLLNRWLRIPLCIGIVHRFGDFDRFYRQRQVRKLADKSWRFVGVSDAVKEHLLDYGCGFTTDNTLAITNAIDIDKAVALQHSREESLRRLGLHQEGIYIGALGRLVPVKGHIYLIQAFARIAANYGNARLVIIGEGRERNRLQEEARRLNLQDRVHLVGFHPDALQYVRAFDVWTMPSLAEGLGLALLEGMSGRLPVIASSVPAMQPLIKGAGGVAVPPGDTEALATALDEILAATPDQRAMKGDEAFAYLQREHDIESYRARYLELINQGLQQVRAGC